MKNFIKVILLSFGLLFASTVFSAGSTYVDTNTNLEWQLSDSSHFKLSEAISYCTKIPPEGNNRWRLPNINELISLIDFKGSPVQDGTEETVLFIKPALLDYTPTITATYYWSSTINKYLSDTDDPVLSVNFAFGETTRLFNDVTDSGLDINRFRTRCVRAHKS